MPLVIPDGYALCAWKWSLLGDPEPMYTTVGQATPVTGQVVAEEFADAWLSQFPASNMGNPWTFLGATVRFGQPSGPPLIYEAQRSVTGTSNQATIPSNCALLVKKATAMGGRANRGRFFVPMTSVGEDGVDGHGMMSGALVASLQTAWTALHGLLDPVILHDSSSPVSTPTPVTSFIVQRQIATQRRRMRH